MKPSLILAVLAAILIAADKPNDAATAERQKLQGTWQFVQLLQGDMDKTEDNKQCELTLDGDKLKICFNEAGQPQRPTAFNVKGTEYLLVSLERRKK